MPDEVLLSFVTKKTYIAHGEALVCLLALWTERALFRHCSVLWLIDNLGVLSCLCKGSSNVADFGCIIHATLLAVAGLNSLAWFDHVQSADNLSDGGSRGCSKMATALGFTLRPVPMPPWPTHPLCTTAAQWCQLLDL